MGKVYTTNEVGRYGVRKAIEAIKEAMPIEIYAAEHTELKGHGNELRGRCPAHGGDNPTSFSVNPEKGLFHCHACGAGGDIIDLYRAVEGGELWEAVVGLSLRFNVALPERSGRWRQWSDEKGRRREMIRRIRVRHYQRRLLRLFREELDGISDPEERRREAEQIYDDLYHLALRCALQRESV